MPAAWVGAAGALVGGVSGALNSGGSSSSGSQQPWNQQAPYLEASYQEAQQALAAEQGVQGPSAFVAQENHMQGNSNTALYNQGMNAATTYAPWAQVGSNLAGTQGTYTNNATNIANSGIGAMSPATQGLLGYAQTGQMPGESSVNPALAASVTQGGQSGISALGAAGSTMGQVASAALNPNGALNAGLAGAAAYTNNPTLDASIQAANYQTNLGLTENTLPQIRAAASQGGNANSSREGALEGIATQSASANMANTAAQMESSAYNTGANLGETGYLQGLNTALGAGNAQTALGTSSGNLLNTQQGLQQQAQQYGIGSQITAANDAASQALGYQSANTAAQLSANGQLGTGLGLGLNATNAAYQGTLGGYSAAQGAGTYQQTQDQNAITNNNDLINYAQTEPSNILNQYYNIIGQKQGSLTNSTVTPNNGGLGGGIAGALGGASTASGFFNNNGGQNSQLGQYLNSLFGSSSTGTASPLLSSGTATSNGGQFLQNMGFYNPLPTT